MLRHNHRNRIPVLAGLLFMLVSFLLPSAALAGRLSETPPELFAVAEAGPVVELQWSLERTKVSGYLLERSESATSGFEVIYEPRHWQSSYTDNRVREGKTYYYRIRGQKHYDDYSPYSAVIPVVVDFTAPSVALTEPAGDLRITAPQEVYVSADASDATGVDRVEFYVNDILFTTVEKAPFNFTAAVDATHNGQYKLHASAVDHVGNQKISASRTVTIDIPTAIYEPVPGSFQFGAASYSVSEGGGRLNVDVQRIGGSDGPVTVDFRTLTFDGYGDADWQTDYNTIDWSPLAFADGETSKTVAITINEDNLVEGNETFSVLLGNPTGGATLGATTTSVVTIADNDQVAPVEPVPGSFQFGAAAYSVDEGAGRLSVEVQRVGGSDGPVTIDFRTLTFDGFGDADWSTDYGTIDWFPVAFANGETSKTVSITINEDGLVEGNETFSLLLGNPTGGATLGATTTSVVTIIDNDQAAPVEPVPGSFGFSSATYSVDEGAGQLAVTVQRTGGSDGAVTVDFRTRTFDGYGDADWSSDYGTIDWFPVAFADGETSKTVSIAINEDDLVEGDETFSVLLNNPLGGATLGTLTTATATILDNDENTATTPTDLGPVKAFPFAEGFGTDTLAGRYGTIYKVTNLNDSGPGSLRAAIDAAGPRIIVFEVGGTIQLNSGLNIRNPYVTIAGQSAPFPGISLKGHGITVTTHDVLVQHIRIRVGDQAPADAFTDAVQILNSGAYNIVFDHVSAAWAMDENIVIWNYPKDITFSNCIATEGIGERHGMLLGDSSTNIAIIDSLLANNRSRNPTQKGGTSVVFLNNLVYNPGGSPMSITDNYNKGPSYTSAVGNMFIEGPNSDPQWTKEAIGVNSSVKAGSQVYASDNVFTQRILSYATTWGSPVVNTSPLALNDYSVRSSSQVEANVLRYAGARPAERDSIDQRAVDSVATRGGRHITSQSEVGGWPTLQATRRAFDPGQNPHGDDNGNGYTNIEEILYQMALDVEGR